MDLTLVVFILYFIVIIGLTLYASRRMLKTSSATFESDYFVGGRRIGPIALAILVAAGVCSTGTFIGGPGLAGANGWGFIILFGFGQLVMNLFILGILGKKINIIARRVNAQSYLDVFRHRYASYKPLIGLLIVAILVFLITAASAEFVGGSRVIKTMTGIPFAYSLIGFGVIITAYTALGGLKGVTTVAILQGIIMTVASVVLIVGFIIHFGGVAPVFNEYRQINPIGQTPGGATPLLTMFNFWITYGIGVLGLAWGVQGTLSYGSVKTMKRAIVAGIIMVTFWSVFMSVAGVAAKVLFPNLSSSDLLIPNLTETVLPGALSGLVLAALAGAGQSTIGALFILASGTLVVSAYRTFTDRSLSARQTQLLSIIVTIGVGILVILLAFNPPSTLQIFITLSQGGSAAALAPTLILGLFWPRTNKYGALAGVIIGFSVYLVVSEVDLGIGIVGTLPLLVAAPLAIIGTVLVSLLTAEPPKQVVAAFFGRQPAENMSRDDARTSSCENGNDF